QIVYITIMKIKVGSNRSFGFVFSIVFLLIALWPLLNNSEIRIWSLIISAIFLILGFLNSIILNPLNILWFKFGLLLGKLISPLVMGLIFFCVVTPIGILMKIFMKDLLKLKYNNKNSYWVDKNGPKSKMSDQF
ncbi:SxtJ family membrane protein, partial [Candidatus Pelagibacter sp.]|nr:SxtJ family membrane protein [Candidatus Pelagibacter sp.]